MSNTINCPHCNNEIDVEEALSHKQQQELDKAFSEIKIREEAVRKSS